MAMTDPEPRSVPEPERVERAEHIPDDAPDAVFDKAIEDSGLMYMVEQCYPITDSQFN